MGFKIWPRRIAWQHMSIFFSSFFFPRLKQIDLASCFSSTWVFSFDRDEPSECARSLLDLIFFLNSYGNGWNTLDGKAFDAIMSCLIIFCFTGYKSARYGGHSVLEWGFQRLNPPCSSVRLNHLSVICHDWGLLCRLHWSVSWGLLSTSLHWLRMENLAAMHLVNDDPKAFHCTTRLTSAFSSTLLFCSWMVSRLKICIWIISALACLADLRGLCFFYHVAYA